MYDSKILEFHTTYVDQSFTPPAYMPKTKSAGVAADYMRILTLELDKIALPQNVTYVLKAMGASMVAAIADGTLPVGDILLAATTVSAVAIIAANWDDVAPKFDKIISAFQKAFSTVSSNITSAFAKIKSDAKKEADKANEKTDSKELEKIKNKIPDKLKDENGNVDLTKFKKRVGKGSNVGYQEDVTGQDWVIQKDRGANSGTGGHGSVWKLKTQKQFKSESGRIATLNENGKILRG